SAPLTSVFISFPYTTPFLSRPGAGTAVQQAQGRYADQPGDLRAAHADLLGLRSDRRGRVLRAVLFRFQISQVPRCNTGAVPRAQDRKSTRLNSSHVKISYAV